MKKRIINAVIAKKFDEWVGSIKDEEVAALVKQNTIITGGCIASMINNEEVNDFDVYFTDEKTVVAVARYYVQQFTSTHKDGAYIQVFTAADFKDENSSLYISAQQEESQFAEFYHSYKDRIEDGRVYLYIESRGVAGKLPESEEDMALQEDAAKAAQEETAQETKDKYHPVFFSSNAISLANKIQIVVRFCGSPEEIHKNFDYLHATNYWVSKERELVLNLPAYAACHNKELVYIGSKYPVCSLFRMRKFLSRGFTITAGEILKIAMNINEFDLTNVNVLCDQLTGVDTAYFAALIRAVKQGHSIDRQYVSTILDRMYN